MSGHIDDLKVMEHSTLKVPYETLNKQYRNVQKAIDRDCNSISQHMNQIDKITKTSTETTQTNLATTKSELLNSLVNVVEKLRILKRRTYDLRSEEKNYLKLIKKRIEHLKNHDAATPTIASNNNNNNNNNNNSDSDLALSDTQLSTSKCELSGVKLFKKQRTDRMLIDYFLRSGYYNTAQLLANKSKLQDMTNIDIFLIEKEISDSLRNKDTVKCLNWCNENKSKLKKINSNLEFTLRQQEFIELVRAQKCLEAVYHARKYFVNLTPQQLVDVQKSMVLLAYVKSSDACIYQIEDLLSESRWDHIIELFKADNYKIHQLPQQSCFTVILQSGLSALKTPTCFKKVQAIRNPNCPVCHPNFNQIAKPLPYAYCSNSKLICSYTGAPLNENNVAMMLPNGYVYGYNSLLLLMDENNGKIKCPRTNQLFDFHEAQKVFIL